MTTMPPTADMNQETGAVGGQGGPGSGGGAAPPPPAVLGPRKPSEQFTVDDFLYEMESRPQNRGSLGNGTPMGAGGAAESGVFSEENSDMYAQLEQKERDLVLAAELGKVLLDKNEELSRQNERIAEEFSFKLEVRGPKDSQLSQNLRHYRLGDFLSKQLIHVTCDRS